MGRGGCKGLVGVCECGGERDKETSRSWNGMERKGSLGCNGGKPRREREKEVKEKQN